MSGSSNGTLLPAIRQAIGTLAVDRVTAEVISAFDAAGIPSILLKGPSIARWLYPAGGRGYVDTDLLVQRQQFSRASDLLKDLGFVELLKGFAPFERDSAVRTRLLLGRNDICSPPRGRSRAGRDG
jgi:hypothetical protein